MSEELDELIERFIGIKTPREIAERAGVESEDVIRRARAMRDEIDAITLEETITFLMMRLNRIAAKAEDDASQATDARDKGSLYSAAVSAIKESLRQINVLKKENQGAVAALNAKRLQEILRLFDVIVARGVSEISTTYDLQEDELMAVFQGHIVDAAREIED